MPDFVPVAGFTDDAGVLAAALATIAAFITAEVIRQAEAKLRDTFGDDV